MAKKQYKHPRRTPRALKMVITKITKYYFNNPHANGQQFIADKFKVSQTIVRKAISDELEKRFKKAQEMRNKY
jgi:hypothetical protein